MVKETKKKRQAEFQGNTFNQNLDSIKFAKDYQTWKDNCQGISGETLMVENVPSLYDFLFTHVFGNIRPNSVNSDKEGQGAREALQVIEGIIDGGLIRDQEIFIVDAMADVLEALQDTSLDPKDILFTEFTTTRGNRRRRKVKVRGHYRTENYEKKTGKKATPPEWRAGNNPPHQALFSETETQFAKPKGLLHIMRDAKDELKDIIIDELEIEEVRGGAPPRDYEDISAIEDYFDKVIKNTAFWSAGGKLLVNKVRQDLQSRTFKLMNKDQDIVANLARFNAEGKKQKPAGTIREFRLTSTATPIIELVNNALKRAGTNKAPNGYRAWQNARKRGFDYRKTRREKFGEDAKGNLDNKVISKMWQARLWRR